MRKTNVNLGHGLPIIPLNGLEKLVRELKILRKKRIRQDPRTVGLLDDGMVSERLISVKIQGSRGRTFKYFVREYGYIGGRDTFLSEHKYTSYDLKKLAS